MENFGCLTKKEVIKFFESMINPPCKLSAVMLDKETILIRRIN